MRMYADEEEEKIKRRKKLMAVKMQANVKVEKEESDQRDLRHILKPVRKIPVAEPFVVRS